MGALNYVFFDEFKRLEKLCNDIFGVTNGVTCYINSMKATQVRDHYGITDWDADLTRLISLRHKRNLLSHEASFEEQLCTQEDIDWLCDFYDRIINRDDPLALTAKKAALQHELGYSKVTTSVTSAKDSGSFQSKTLPVMIIITVVFLLILLNYLSK